MKKIALLVFVFLFSGCVSTKIFNNLKSETAVLQQQVKELESDRNFLTKMLRTQNDNMGGLIKTFRAQDENVSKLIKRTDYLFTKVRDYDGQLLEHGAGLGSASKDLEDLDEKVNKLGKKLKTLSKDLDRAWSLLFNAFADSGKLAVGVIPAIKNDIWWLQETMKKHLREHK